MVISLDPCHVMIVLYLGCSRAGADMSFPIHRLDVPNHSGGRFKATASAMYILKALFLRNGEPAL